MYKSSKRYQLLVDLLLTFAKIGLFTFGGGYAMISIIENICVEQKKWISHEDMMNVIVIAESTPGPIAINCATFVGCRQAGFWGGLLATSGIIIPSFTVIFVISAFLDNFLEIPLIASAFKGIRIAVGILILDAAVTMIKKMPKKPFAILVLVFSFSAMLLINVFSWKFSSVNLMLISAAAGMVWFLVTDVWKWRLK